MKKLFILILISFFLAGYLTVKNRVQNLSSTAATGCIQTTTSSRTSVSGQGAYTLCSGQPVGSAGISIDADNITLNCNNIALSGGGRNNEPGILINGRTNITLDNCTVSGFFTGITAKNSSIIVINGGNFSGNSYGSPVSRSQGTQNSPVENLGDQNQNTGGGIQFENVADATITNAAANNAVAGIILLNSTRTTVSGGNFSNNSGWGIKLKSSTNNTIEGITANNNNRWCDDGSGVHKGCETSAILLIDNSDNNTIRNNTLNDSGDGFYINGCAGHAPSNYNKITGNSANGATDGNGFESTFSTGNEFYSNTTTGSRYGFWLGYSDKNIVSQNTAGGNTGAINIANSRCNAVTNNQETSGTNPNENHIWYDVPDAACEAAAPAEKKSCHDNLLANNSPALGVGTNCTNTSSTSLPASCGVNITTTPNPTPTGANCPTSSANTYQSQSITNVGDNTPAQNHPDKNLHIRGFIATQGMHNLVQISGPTDTKAPQLSTLFDNLRSMPGIYQVYDWDWTNSTKGPPITKWPVTLIGLSASPGDQVKVPDSGYDVGGGNDAMVLYADVNTLTLKYTREDNITPGYAVHIHDFCTDPNLLALYNQLNSAGRSNLPTIKGNQAIGTATSNEVKVAIRDSGEFMDPRSDKDWWIGYTILPTPGATNTPPPGTTNTPVPNPTSTPSAGKTFLRVNVHMGSTAGALFNGAQTGNNPYDGKHLVVYITGPTSRGGQFGEQIYVPGVSGVTCSSKTGFHYACGEGFVVWKGADGVSGTTPGGYTVRILTVPSGWEIVSSSVSDSGNLTPGSTLTLNLAVRLIGNQPTATPDPNATPTETPQPTLPNPTPTAGAARATGDVDGNGFVNIIDYLYYTRAVTGGTIPSTVDPDVNGDGHISPEDRTIIVTILQQQKGF